eukprot:11146351-Ditylum_brightwellii.AAC.1
MSEHNIGSSDKGRYINLLTKGKDNIDMTYRKVQQPGKWYDYFVNWEGIKERKTMEDTFHDTRLLKWNIVPESDGSITY